MSFWRNLILSAAIAVLSVPSFAQKKTEQVDSLVNLLSAQSMELIEQFGISYRKVTGPARFLHNNTYLICDTAMWNVNRGEIEAYGNVRILQEQTVLSSDRLTYIIDEDLAQFRGSLVQLEDKDRNTLRTKYLDYNTKDSVAIFRYGGSMKDKEGQVIESLNGTYDSKAKLFTFTDNVNMYTDSIFVKTTRIEYRTDTEHATFGRMTDVWKDSDMLSSDDGWYDRKREMFFFRDKVHMLTDTQEAWSDSLFFNRNTTDVEMLGNVQLTDTTRNATAVAGRLEYINSLSQVTLTRDPAIIGVTDSTGTARDTVYLGGDLLRMRSFRRCDVDSIEVASAGKRLEDINSDAVGAYRKAAWEEAERAAEEARRQDADYQAEQNAKAIRDARERQEDELPQADSLSVPKDSLSVPMDSLTVSVDSLSMVPAPPKDTTSVAFLQAKGRVRLYREDFQMRCDSLEFNELDSLVRLHRNPLVWNDGNRQYASDSIYVAFGNNNLDRAYLMSNAFVTVEEAPECYDQIRSAEMLAYFDEEGLLRRFDALGGADAIFYLQEDSTFATVNKSQAKLLSAQFRKGELDSVDYYQDPKNDAFPLAQMKSDDRVLKGFNWTPELRPSGREDITDYVPRVSQRRIYESRPRAKFTQTDLYFPGYMADVYRKLAAADSAKAASGTHPEPAEDLASGTMDPEDNPVMEAEAEDTGVHAEEAEPAEQADQTEQAEQVEEVDPVAGPADSAEVSPREAARLVRTAKREEKWARLDSLDAAKAAAKAEKKAERERQKKLKLLKARAAHDEKDAARLEKYRLRYEQRKSKKKQ